MKDSATIHTLLIIAGIALCLAVVLVLWFWIRKSSKGRLVVATDSDDDDDASQPSTVGDEESNMSPPSTPPKQTEPTAATRREDGLTSSLLANDHLLQQPESKKQESILLSDKNRSNKKKYYSLPPSTSVETGSKAKIHNQKNQYHAESTTHKKQHSGEMKNIIDVEAQLPPRTKKELSDAGSSVKKVGNKVTWKNDETNVRGSTPTSTTAKKNTAGPTTINAKKNTVGAGVVDGAKSSEEENNKKKPFILTSLPSRKVAYGIFDELDVNGNNRLVYRQLGTALERLFPNVKHHASIKKAFESPDGAKCRYVKREQFEYLCRYAACHNDTWDIFSISNGEQQYHVDEMSIPNFIKKATDLGVGGGDALFTSMELMGDGVVTFDGYCRWIAKHTSDWDKEEEEEIVASSPPVVNPEYISLPDELTLSLPTKEQAFAVFDEVDVDNNQVLTLGECEKVCRRLFSGLKHKAPIRKAYDVAVVVKKQQQGGGGGQGDDDDDNDNLVLKRDEFECFIRYIVYHNDAYNYFCNDRTKAHTNKMHPSDFMKVSTQLGVLYSNDNNEVFQLMDHNKTGSVTFDEYCTWMAHNTCEWEQQQQKGMISWRRKDTELTRQQGLRNIKK